MIIDERGIAHLRRACTAAPTRSPTPLRPRGVRDGDGVGIMCRNHRGFVEATLAAAKLGASALYLNTMFAGPQLAEVIEREGPKALVYDEEFAGLLDEAREAGQEIGLQRVRRLDRRGRRGRTTRRSTR